MTGIEPTLSAWKAEALPLCNIRVGAVLRLAQVVRLRHVWGFLYLRDNPPQRLRFILQ
jgi:hypothetical protein